MCRFTCRFALCFLILIALSPHPALGQTYKVIHTFTGGADGGNPAAGLTMDAAGNLFGTTSLGANQSCTDGGCGTVFKLKRSGSSWVITPLYSFQGGNDGAYPYGRVVIAGDGTLYGTTFGGGGNGCGSGCGTVFHLAPSPTAPKTALAPWSETVLYRFTGGSDGAEPVGDLIFDKTGNIYGSALSGGTNDGGVIYELTPSGGSWTETALYRPQNDGRQGVNPTDGPIFDSSGSLYGTFRAGGPENAGTVYQLSPSGSAWTEHTLYTFTGGSDGGWVWAGLLMDASGNLYGATSKYGTGGGGTVFELMPSGGGLTLNTLQSFSGNGGQPGPLAKLIMDAAGNLYGTTNADGAHECGSVFKLTPSNGSWTYTSLHDFTCGSDGWSTSSSLVFDANGNLYGTTYAGGNLSQCGGIGCGVVFEITP